MREGTSNFKPSDEMKLKAWEFMKKYALPRMIEAERKKKNESKNNT